MHPLTHRTCARPQRAWTPDCGGGLLWAQPGAGRPASIANNYKAAVANQLFMALSVMLSEQSGSNERSAYTQEFERTWGWLQGRGVVRPDGSVYDGINPDCKLHPGWPLWSYNQVGRGCGCPGVGRGVGGAGCLWLAGFCKYSQHWLKSRAPS